jgi:prophage regulatory protein
MQLERQLVSKKDLKTLGIPYSFQHVARLEAAGKFPKRVQLGLCQVAWRYEEVMGWIAGRVALRDAAKR